MKQKVKISYILNNKPGEVLFFDHSFKSAFEHSEDYVNRNAGKFPFKRYMLNESPYGKRWLYYSSH